MSTFMIFLTILFMLRPEDDPVDNLFYSLPDRIEMAMLIVSTGILGRSHSRDHSSSHGGPLAARPVF